MGNPQDTDRVTTDAVDTTSPGRRLRQAREARQMTCEAVAAQLRIEAKLIESLERDDYAGLPAAVFVRGYLRAYAKLVGLVAEPLVDAFDQRTTHAPPPLVLPAAVGPDIESHSGYARWIVFALAALSMLLFYQWWHLDGETRTAALVKPAPSAQSVPQETAAVVEMPATPPLHEPGVSLETLYPAPSDESGLDAVDILTPAAQTESIVPAAPTMDSVVPVTPGQTPAQAQVPTIPAPPQNPPPSSAPPVTTAAVEPPPTASGPLVLRFAAECWVVIRDADGRALLQGLIKGGERHALDGKPPFQLTLGNAPAVEIEYLGQRFDQSRYTGASNIARFTLGQ